MKCFDDIYFWRQNVILIAACLQSVGTGFILAYPAVLNLAILSPNSTDIKATSDQASWIGASLGFSGPIGFLFIPLLMQLFGRRIAHIALAVVISIGFLIFVFARSISSLYAARIIQGLSICAVYVTTIILGEYSDPKRRGYFVAIKKGSTAVGSLICHTASLYWTWREIALIAITPNILALSLTFIWPESPAFLASKGKYEECDKAFTWLHGNSPKARKELKDLISAQILQREANKKQKSKVKKLIRKFLKRNFLIPFLIVSLLTMIVDASGRYYMPAYIIQMLTEIMGDKTIAIYCTIGADSLTFFALIISCFFITHFERRAVLFIFGAISVFLMFLTSLLAYLKLKHNFCSDAYWLIPGVIILNIFTVNVGVMPICFAIISEIFPLEHKGMGSFSTGIVFTILFGIVLKFTPVLMATTGIQGTFAIYALSMIIVFLILYFLLIETKDKTLQEIENEINYKRNKKLESPLATDELLSS